MLGTNVLQRQRGAGVDLERDLLGHRLHRRRLPPRIGQPRVADLAGHAVQLRRPAVSAPRRPIAAGAARTWASVMACGSRISQSSLPSSTASSGRTATASGCDTANIFELRELPRGPCAVGRACSRRGQRAGGPARRGPSGLGDPGQFPG